VRAFIAWIYSFALSLGGPGLFTVAFLDSSFISLPQINDILVVLMVTNNKALMPYYACMATAGSVTGCYVIYYLAKKGGEAFVRKRLKAGHVERSPCALQATWSARADWYLRSCRRRLRSNCSCWPQGLAEVRPLQFVLAIAAARGARYLALGILAIYYGDLALELMRTHGSTVALVLVGLIVAGAVLLWLRSRTPKNPPSKPESRIPVPAPCRLITDVLPQPARGPRRQEDDESDHRLQSD
jgi:membrane protein YqaA with SNARE-associated domain